MGTYTPVGDITVLSICLLIIVLMAFSYVRNTSSFKVFLSIVGLLILSSTANIVYHLFAQAPGYDALAQVSHCVFHAFLFAIFALFTIYIAIVTHLEKTMRRTLAAISIALLVVIVVADAVVAARELASGVPVDADYLKAPSTTVFMCGYLAFSALEVFLMAQVRNRIYLPVMMGFFGSITISFIVLFLQSRFGQTSFTVATFLYPVIAMFYILHSNPYDVELGAIDSREFSNRIRYNYENHREFVFVSLFLNNYEEVVAYDKKAARQVRALIRDLVASFKGSLMFQIGRRQEVILFSTRRNPDCHKSVTELVEPFFSACKGLGYDYRIVAGTSIDEISRNNEYIGLVKSAQASMGDEVIHWITPEDVEHFSKTEVIRKELEDIYHRRDLDDPRVLAYCQPVLNIKTGEYDTAEALMRLRLDGIGLVFPDQFIPLAEEYGFIHVLTEIILHKTCQAIRSLMDEGFEVRRISVNVSVPELKDDGFCDDINRIIVGSGIPGNKIAIEITESQSESDFLLMKEKIDELRTQGITFYLDDFGTGYSNMERIMELPFDIIKFDRSLVVASGSSERSKKIVLGLANMFSKMNYSVLYEGVEDGDDERMCIGMAASYLQGYKYSRPVPISELTEYFVRA